jgi:hypothetical protein
MLTVCGTALNYKNIMVTKVRQISFQLLSIYYVFDRKYPAQYGLLSVIVICVFCNSVEITQSNFLKKNSFVLKAFIRKCYYFLKKNNYFLKELTLEQA